MKNLRLKPGMKVPTILTFLAPAKKCNQACPSCILTEVNNEPVREFDLSPSDYALFVKQFIDADIPILDIAFQGYEVTLPQSWAYLEQVFKLAQKHNIPRSFVTNGMLLHKHVKSIQELEVDRISVSIDGSTPEVNDPIRGLKGAFDTTVKSVENFFAKAPEYKEKMAIVSCLYSEENFQSLKDMPSLMNKMGVSRWGLAFEIVKQEKNDFRGAHAASQQQLVLWLKELRAIAMSEKVDFFVNDEFGFLNEFNKELRSYDIFDFDFLYRMDPLGHVATADDVLNVWNPETRYKWNPEVDNAPEKLEYYEKSKKYIN